MTRRRYVVRFQGPGPKPAADAEHVRHRPGVTVLAESSTMLLIEGDDDAVPALAAELSGWLVAPEQSYSLPDQRKPLG